MRGNSKGGWSPPPSTIKRMQMLMNLWHDSGTTNLKLNDSFGYLARTKCCTKIISHVKSKNNNKSKKKRKVIKIDKATTLHIKWWKSTSQETPIKILWMTSSFIPLKLYGYWFWYEYISIPKNVFFSSGLASLLPRLQKMAW